MSPCRRCGKAHINRNGYCADHQELAIGWRKRQVGKTTTQRGYGHSWRLMCKPIKMRDKFCCVPCGERGLLTPVFAVDHIVPKAVGGTDAESNLQCICRDCHREKTKIESAIISDMYSKGIGLTVSNYIKIAGVFSRVPRPPKPNVSFEIYNYIYPLGLQPSLPNLVIVCGPPGSGKSTYVNNNRGSNDLVICLDSIASERQGCGEHHHSIAGLNDALQQRNNMLRGLACDRTHDNAWFIVSAPRRVERDWWSESLDAKQVVLLDVPASECSRRINGDGRRNGRKQDMCELVSLWWSEFTK